MLCRIGVSGTGYWIYDDIFKFYKQTLVCDMAREDSKPDNCSKIDDLSWLQFPIKVLAILKESASTWCSLNLVHKLLIIYEFKSSSLYRRQFVFSNNNKKLNKTQTSPCYLLIYLIQFIIWYPLSMSMSVV